MTFDHRHLKVAVVGYGSIGRRHVENLGRLGVERITIVRRAGGLNPAFEPPLHARIVHTADAALEGRLDLAVICNPTSLHLAAARPFVESCIPTLIEKPIAANLRQLQAAESWLASASSSVGMAYCLRYHPAYMAAYEALQIGLIGELQSARNWFESYLPDWHPWEDHRTSYAARRDLGGGVLPTLDHELDFLHWCLGTPSQAVGWTKRSGALDMPVDDLAEIEMRFAGGVQSTTRLSLCRRERSRGFEFVGSDGVLSFDWQVGNLTWRSTSEKTVEVSVLWRGQEYDVNGMYSELLREALCAVAAKRELPISWRAGYEALRSAEAAMPTVDRIVPNRPDPVNGHPKAAVFA